MQHSIKFQKDNRIGNVINLPHQDISQNLITADWIKNLIAQPKLLHQLLKKYDSPLNIHNLQYFKENCTAYEVMLNDFHLRSQLIFARKANGSKIYLHAAEQAGIGVDATSFEELKEGLESEVDPEKIVVSGADKSEKLLQLAINYNVLIIVENPEECQLLHSIAEERGKRAKIGFRLSNFTFDGKKCDNKSGFDIDKVDEFIINHLGYTGDYVMLEYEGLFFDFDGSVELKGNALHQCLDLADRLYKYGIKTKFIDIKGEAQVKYPLSDQRTKSFDDLVDKAMKNDCKSAGRSYGRTGFDIIDGKLSERKRELQYRKKESNTDFLKKVLEYSQAKGGTVASRLIEKSIQLKVELGRPLLDQCGFTICSVASHQKNDSGDILVLLEMNKFPLSDLNKAMAMTPFIICQNQTNGAVPVEVLLTDTDSTKQKVVMLNKTKSNQYPKIGDLVIFLNTAANTKCFLRPNANALAKNLTYAKKQNQLIFNAS